MFVRFRQAGHKLQTSLIETRRVDGKVRHEHIAGLGSIILPPSVTERITFWQRLHDRLAKLANRVDPEMHGKVLGAVPRLKSALVQPASLRMAQMSICCLPSPPSTFSPRSNFGTAWPICTPGRLRITRAWLRGPSAQQRARSSGPKPQSVRGSSTNWATVHRKSCCQRSCVGTSAVRTPLSALFIGSISVLHLERSLRHAPSPPAVSQSRGDTLANAEA